MTALQIFEAAPPMLLGPGTVQRCQANMKAEAGGGVRRVLGRTLEHRGQQGQKTLTMTVHHRTRRHNFLQEIISHV